MTLRLTPLLALLLVTTPLAWAHGDEKHSAELQQGRDSAQAKLSISPEAADAVAVLERFSAALSAGDVAAAANELDPSVLILESGGAERSRDEYLAGHAKNDADFLKTAHMSLLRRTGHASGELAWIASESSIHTMQGGNMLMIDSTESAVLHKGKDGWKIVHLHWSSRRAGAGH